MKLNPGAASHSGRWIAGALACAAGAWGQASSTISIDNGVSFSIEADLGAPAATERVKTELLRASGDSFYRIFTDQNGLAIFAYELELTRASEENEFRVIAKPAGDEFASRFPAADGGKPVPTVSSDKELDLSAGASVEIGLFSLEGQGLRVIDTVRIVLIPPGAAESASQTSAPGSLLRLSGLQISVNGMALKTQFGGAVVGRYALLYLPGRGAYFLSTGPVAGRNLINAGSIDRDHMQFTIDNEVFDVTTDLPILTRADTGELWVFHDPNYAPSGNWTALPDALDQTQADRSFTAAADSLQWWLR